MKAIWQPPTALQIALFVANQQRNLQCTKQGVNVRKFE
jgi:hypothetical protein